MPKILHLVRESPLFPIGGMGVAVHELCLRLARNHDVIVLGIDQKKQEHESFYVGFGGTERVDPRHWPFYSPGRYRLMHVRGFNDLGLPHRPYADFMAERVFNLNLVDKLRWFRPSVIHEHDSHLHHTADLASVLLTSGGETIPIVNHAHLAHAGALATDQWVDDAFMARMSSEVHGWHRSAAVIAISKFYRKMLEDHMVAPDRIADIPNGVQIEMIDAAEPDVGARARLGIPLHKTVVGFIGRLVAGKGVDILCDVAGRMPDHHFVVVSNRQSTSEDDIRIKEMDAAVARGNVTWLDGLRFEAKWPVLKAVVDVAVMPSRHEPFGIVAAEWMAARKPLIFSNIDGPSEFAVGVPVEPSVEAVEAALRSRAWAAVDVNAARAVAETLSWDVAAERLESLYARVTNYSSTQHAGSDPGRDALQAGQVRMGAEPLGAW